MIRWRRCQDVCIHYPGRSEGPSPGRTTLWSKHDVQFHFLQQMPRHTGYPVDCVIRLRGGVVINPVLYWARGHRDPWYLADPHQVARMYRKRMQPERYFKDGKQHFGLNRSTVTTTGRLQRLLAGCCWPADIGGDAGVASLPTPSMLPREAGHPAPGLRILRRHTRPA